MRKLHKAMIFLVLLLNACEPPPAPPPPEQSSKIVVCVIPGLGDPQTDDVVTRLTAVFGDEINVVDFGTGKNGYLANLRQYLETNPHDVVILIGHSYGTDKINQTLPFLSNVKLVIYCDPVPQKLGGRYTVTPNVERCVNLVGKWIGLFRATIDGPVIEHKIDFGHNEMMHESVTLDWVELYVTLSLVELELRQPRPQ